MIEVPYIVLAALPVNNYILIGAGLVIAVVIILGALFLFRSPSKKKGTQGKTDASANAGAAGWQSGQQSGVPGGWGWPQPPADSWGAQNPASQQAGGWGQPVQPQPPGGWGAPAQQPQANAWGSPTPNTPSTGAGTGGSPNAWDATFMPQQAAPAAQDAWGQPQVQSAPLQQPAWGSPAQPQAPTAYGGGSGQSWGQANAPAASSGQPWGQPNQSAASSPDPWNMTAGPQASAPQAWGQPAQQSSAPAAGVNPGMPSWQQGPNPGQGFGSPAGANPFGSSDNDKTMLRPNSPMGALGVVRVEEGKEPGRVYEVRKEELSIGRSRESDIFLEDLAVSRLHAKILSLGNGNYALKDEGSANGTKVNGQLVNKYQTYPLQEGDKIQLGQTVLVFAKR